MNDDVARWMSEAAWSALMSLVQLPQFATLVKDIEKNNDDWERCVGICDCPSFPC
jgi:hypothetical protein